MDVTCDNERCKKEFDIKLRKKKHGINVVEHFFFCPHCKTRYSSHVTNQDIRKRQRDMRKYHEKLGELARQLVAENIDNKEYGEKIAFIGEKERELKMLVDALKKKYN